MFKSKTQKQIEELEKLVSVIQDIEKQLPELIARKEELQNAISEKLGFKKIESTNKKEVISNEVLEIAKPAKTEKVMQPSTSFFISEEMMKKNRLAIHNAFKKQGVKIAEYQTEGMKKKGDKGIKAKEGQNTDDFNKSAQELKEILEAKGLRFVEWNRKYNKVVRN